MGGLGQRFRDAGYSTPKPLIEVEGKPMFMHALASFDAYKGPKQYLFVVRDDAEAEFGLATSIQGILPSAKIAMLDHNTRGATESCLAARELIDRGLPLIVMDCDFSFSSDEYFSKVTELAEQHTFDGVLLSFTADNARYSYAKVDEHDVVIEVAEKQVISNHALAGAYCFGSGGLFLDTADKLLTQPISETMKEYYISYVYRILLEEQKRIVLATARAFNSFGTPEELSAYLEHKK